MGTRKRISVNKGDLKVILDREQKYGQMMGYIMHESNCSWKQAKKIFEIGRVERAIAREFKLINTL